MAKTMKVGKYTPPGGGSQINPIAAGYYGSPNFNPEVEAVAAPARDEQNLRQIFLTDPKFSKFLEEGKKTIVNGRALSGTDLSSYVMERALSGIDFSGFSKKTKPPTTSTVTTKTNAPMMSALTQYATGMQGSAVNPAINAGYGQLSTDAQARAKAQQDAIDQFYGGAETQLSGLNSQALAMLQNMYNQTTGEIGTQAEAGRTTIDETTQRALEALGGQSNPYAGLQMANVGAVTDPMAAYSQAVGAPQGGIQALQDMLQSQNATTSGGFSNLAQLLGASNQAAQQSRIGDVNVARAGAQQDLSANQRAAGLQALQQLNTGQMNQQNQFSQQMLGLGQNRLQAGMQNQSGLGDFLNQLGLGQLQGNLSQQQNTQGRQDQLMQQLIGLAGQGVDVSQIMALLGGQ